MKTLSILILICLFLFSAGDASAREWDYIKSLPPDVLKMVETQNRSGALDLIREHLRNHQSHSDQAVIGMVCILIEGLKMDAPDFFQDYRLLMLSRPSVALTMTTLLTSEGATSGHIKDGRFVMGRDLERLALPANAERRNRWLAIKLVLEVRAQFTIQTPVETQAQSLAALAGIIAQQGRQEEVRRDHFMGLTSLTEEPTIEQGQGYGWSPAAVGDDPQAWFFSLPESFEKAKSDGERWRWALHQLAALGGDYQEEAMAQTASVMQSVFTAASLPGLSSAAPIVGLHKIPETPETALQTLDDDETVVISGGKLVRLRLPADFAFLPLMKGLIRDDKCTSETRKHLIERLSHEWRARWQYDRLAEFLKEMPELPGPHQRGQEPKRWVMETEAPRLRFEPCPSQAAGKSASLRVTFRNARQAKFTAHLVDMRKVIADIDQLSQQPIEDKKDPDAWKWRSIEGLDVRLRDKNSAQWFTGDPITWVTDLPTVEHHWDQQQDLPTPLIKAGVYFIECDAGMGAPAQTLLWLDDIVTVTIPQQRLGPQLANTPSGDRVPTESQSRLLVLDAATGEPVPDAHLTITGGYSINPEKPSLPFTTIERTTDEQGSIVLSERELPNSYQWLLRLEDKSGRFHIVDHLERYDPRRESYDQDVRHKEANLLILSDQPVYRPGQDAKWKAWMRHRDFNPDANTNRYANDPFTVSLSAPQAPNHMLQSTGKFDEEAAASGVLPLPENGVLGRHSIHISARYESSYLPFPVETFRKPEFVAEASAGTQATKLGGTFEFKIKARYYSGAPLIGGMVRYHVMRQSGYEQRDETKYPAAEWDWLYRNGYLWRPNKAWQYHSPWRTPESSNDPGGEVMSGLIPLAADGTVSIPVDTTMATQLNGNTTQHYLLRAWVMDSTQKQIELTAGHTINSQPCNLIIDSDRGFYRSGEQASLTLRSFNNAGASVKVTATLQSIAPDGLITDLPITPDTEGVATAKVEFRQSGMHHLQVKALLPDGQEATTRRDLSVAPTGTSAFVTADDDAALDLQLRQTEYAPGDEAEMLITSRLDNATVWLFLRTVGGIYPDPIILRLKNHHAVHRIAISEKDFPNFIVQAITVLDGRVESVTRQVLVPPKHLIARVSIEMDKPNYHPGDHCRAKIITRRFDGSPLQANVTFTAYDKSLEAIAAQPTNRNYGLEHDEAPDIRKYFWGWRRTQVQSLTDSSHFCFLSRQNIPGTIEHPNTYYAPWREYQTRSSGIGDPSASPASIAPGGTPASVITASLNAMLDQTRLRTQFLDSIAWAPDLHTDDKGEVFIEFALPKNLTTWSLRAWAMGPKTEVGEAEKDLTIASPMELRIASPRFLITGDESTVSASLVHSERRTQPVKATIEIEGDAIRLLSDTAHEGMLNADGSTVITWRVKAKKEGSARIRIKAACQDASDGTEIELPVRQPHVPVMENWDLSLASGQQERTLDFIVPENDRPDESRLELRLTPGTLSVIADALPYLAEYPHGCVEQTLNRFLPTLIAHRTMLDLKLDMKSLRETAQASEAERAAMKLPASMQRWAHSNDHPRWQNGNLFDEEKVKDMVDIGLARLAEMAPRNSNGNGGWGWFGGSNQPNIPLTALIIHGFLEARRLGIAVNDNALTSGLTALEKYEDRGVRPEYYTGRKEVHLADDLDALVHVVLIESTLKPATHRKDDWWREVKPSPIMHSQLIDRHDQLTAMSVARLALACHQLNDVPNRDKLVATLKQRVKHDAATHTAWIDVTSNGTWNTDFIETQAMLLRMLVAMEPGSELTAEVARLIISRRSQGRFWNSTRDTAACIEALAVFASATGEIQQSRQVEVLLDGKLKQKIDLEKISSLAETPGIVFDAAELPAGKHQLTLRGEGGGTLPATVALQHYGKATLPPSSAIKLTRNLWRIDPASLQANEAAKYTAEWLQRTVQRQTIDAEHPLHPGDIVEIECQMQTTQPLEYLLMECPLPAGLQPIHSTSGWTHQDDVYYYLEVRDDRTCIFMEQLRPGNHTIRILTRVEHAGIFQVPPATFGAMYAPSFQAITGTSTLNVSSAK
ncbi:hypothetical protein BH11VER1_BH11VER1_10450 [soil metagenome]